MQREALLFGIEGCTEALGSLPGRTLHEYVNGEAPEVTFAVALRDTVTGWSPALDQGEAG